MSKVKLYKGESGQLDSLPIEDGQIIFTTDQQPNIYLDNENERISYCPDLSSYVKRTDTNLFDSNECNDDVGISIYSETEKTNSFILNGTTNYKYANDSTFNSFDYSVLEDSSITATNCTVTALSSNELRLTRTSSDIPMFGISINLVDLLEDWQGYSTGDQFFVKALVSYTGTTNNSGIALQESDSALKMECNIYSYKECIIPFSLKTAGTTLYLWGHFGDSVDSLSNEVTFSNIQILYRTDSNDNTGLDIPDQSRPDIDNPIDFEVPSTADLTITTNNLLNYNEIQKTNFFLTGANDDKYAIQEDTTERSILIPLPEGHFDYIIFESGGSIFPTAEFTILDSYPKVGTICERRIANIFSNGYKLTDTLIRQLNSNPKYLLLSTSSIEDFQYLKMYIADTKPGSIETGTTYSINLNAERNDIFANNYISSLEMSMEVDEQTAYIEDATNNKIAVVRCLPNTTYTITKTTGNVFGAFSYPSLIAAGQTVTISYGLFKSNDDGNEIKLTTSGSDNLLYIYYFNGTGDEQAILNSIQVKETNGILLPKVVNLGETYQNTIFKNVKDNILYQSTLEDEQWYVKEAIGKTLIEDSDSLRIAIRTNAVTDTTAVFNIFIPYIASQSLTSYCKYFPFSTNATARKSSAEDYNCFYISGHSVTNNNAVLTIRIMKSIASTVAEMKTWLAEHPLEIWYEKTNPTYRKIEATQLISQLEAFNSAIHTTNSLYIRQKYTTLPFNIQINNLSIYADLQAKLNEIQNSGVSAISTGETNGTIKVTQDGTDKEVSVAGLKALAYKDTLKTSELTNDAEFVNQASIDKLTHGEESIEKIVAGSIEAKNLFDGTLFKGYWNASTNSLEQTTSTVYVSTKILIKKGNYVMSFGGNTVNVVRAYTSYNTTNSPIWTPANNVTKYVMSITEDTVLYLSWRLASNTDWDYTTKVQLEKGSEPTDYVPFMKYGYNSEKSMGNIVVDDVRCKNLFDINGNVNIQANDGSQVSRNVVNGNILTINSNSSSHHPVGQKFTNLNGKTITFSATVVSAGSSSAALPRIRASITDNGTVVAYTQGTEGGVGDRVSITASCTSDNVVCGFVTMNGTGGQVTDIQVEINDEVTNYVPYKSFDNSESEVYSTNEIKIGRWIDGKPLYRKVINTTLSSSVSTSTSDWKTIYTDTNIKLITDLTFRTASYNTHYFSRYEEISFRFNDTNGTLAEYHTDDYNNSRSVVIIIEYTKTTD